jgi:two-component system chemotaxis sensor kinase CheA
VTVAVPDAVLARCRAQGFERLERIDWGWTALVGGTCPPEREKELYRDLHTLKGDTRIVGLTDVATLCQKLEDLLFAARDRRYRVHEDVDVVVTMAIQFIGMLLRRKGSSSRSGIDLQGFLKQIEEVLSEWLRRSSETPGAERESAPQLRIPESGSHIAAPARRRLASVATTLYLEYLRARGASRERLRSAWTALVDEIGELDATPLAPVLARHGAAGKQLARELGKQADVMVNVGDARASVEVAERLSASVLHAIRNAIDHGIEAPGRRAAAGKPTIGTVRVDVKSLRREIELTVRDDGAGVDFDTVRQRAVEAGLLTSSDARVATTAVLLELLFTPGLSTRQAVTDVSGRGIGMDAARGAIAEVGGEVRITSNPGVGTTMIIRVPQTHRVASAVLFPAAAHEVIFAVEDSWTVEPVDGSSAVDPVERFELEGAPSAAREKVVNLRLRRDSQEFIYRAGGAPRSRPIVRICSTGHEDPIEVVETDGGEALLLRPEMLRP